ncbi:MAG: hypothetical protein LBR17_03105 [Bacteroidales bacterium]|jgi:hypothetical protein|nr:hypothetical protein [Bacteroidales bacterium]
MKVSGFSFIRNALRFDYPIVEAISSILPLCDEFVLALGNSDDATEELISSINSPKIKIIHTIWDETLRKGGRVLAVETDKALQQISADSDWAFYIQGDEVVHEKYYSAIRDAMFKYKDCQMIEGLLFNYTHFYGSYDFIGDSRRWYRKEIRIVRPHIGVHSWGDAQGFRIDNRALKVVPVDAEIYHYGWVKSPFFQQEKQKYFHSLWHDDAWLDKHIAKTQDFDYSQIDSLKRFQGTHPKVMQQRIDNKNWQFDFDPTKKNFGFKAALLHKIEQWTGWRVGEYKNYCRIDGRIKTLHKNGLNGQK